MFHKLKNNLESVLPLANCKHKKALTKAIQLHMLALSKRGLIPAVHELSRNQILCNLLSWKTEFIEEKFQTRLTADTGWRFTDKFVKFVHVGRRFNARGWYWKTSVHFKSMHITFESLHTHISESLKIHTTFKKELG